MGTGSWIQVVLKGPKDIYHPVIQQHLIFYIDICMTGTDWRWGVMYLFGQPLEHLSTAQQTLNSLLMSVLSNSLHGHKRSPDEEWLKKKCTEWTCLYICDVFVLCWFGLQIQLDKTAPAAGPSPRLLWACWYLNLHLHGILICCKVSPGSVKSTVTPKGPQD